MAQAFVTIQQSVNRMSADELEFHLLVNLFGADVSDDAAQAGPHPITSGPIANSASALQIQTAIALRARDFAATLGITVGNGDVLMQSLQKV